MDITAIVHRYNKLNDYRNFMFRILADLPGIDEERSWQRAGLPAGLRLDISTGRLRSDQCKSDRWPEKSRPDAAGVR